MSTFTQDHNAASQLQDELADFVAASQAQDPDFAAAYEDGQRRHAILDKLVKCRRALGLTQKQVAKRMGVTQPTVSGFETESSDPRLSTLQRYARAVECTVDFKLDMPAFCNWMDIDTTSTSYQPAGGRRLPPELRPVRQPGSMSMSYYEDVQQHSYVRPEVERYDWKQAVA